MPARRTIIWAIYIALVALTTIASPALAQHFPRLSAYVDTKDLPQDLLQARPGSANRLAVKHFEYSELSVVEPGAEDPRDLGARIVADLIVRSGVRFDIPGLEAGFGIELGLGEFHAELTILGERLDELPTGTTGVETLANTPFRVELTAAALPIDLVLNPEFFKPMTAGSNGSYTPSTEDSDGDGVPDPARLRVTLGAGLKLVVEHSWDGATEVFFDGTDGAPAFPSFALAGVAAQLGDTGIVLDIEEILLDLSDSASPPALTPEMGGPGWKGVMLSKVKIAFVNGLEHGTEERPLTATDDEAATPGDLAVSLTNFAIGTGGFSGTIAGENLGIQVGLSDLDMTLDSLSLQFTRNVLTGSAIAATMENFPFFEGNPLTLALALDMAGNFTIGLASPGGAGLVTLGVPNVLDFHVHSAYFERRTDPELFLVGLNGQAEILVLDSTDGSGSPKVDVNGLTITSKGEVSLQGGWLTLSKKAGIDFNGFGVTLSSVGFGRTDPNSDTGTDSAQSWIGFSGGVSLVAGLGAEAEMKRLQLLWPKKNGQPGVDIKLDGIKVAFHQPNVVRFEGAVEWFEAASGTGTGPAAEGFAGKLQLDLLALNMTMQSRVVIGKASDPQDFAFFFLDAELQLPAGIPLGGSGVSIYGFIGLLAYGMEPNLSPFPSPVKWVNAFRKSDNVVVQQSGDPAPTWAIRNHATGFGAGVILGTTPDNGFTANAKIALTISVPGPVVMLTGQANVLKARTELSSNTNPLFVAVALYDGRENIFVLNIGVFYELEKILKVSGEAEAFFDLDNPANWHLYLGQRTPEERRITADVLGLFKASSYYMIEPTGLGFGAKVSYGGRWKYGPLRVVLEAWLAYDAGLSWRPIHTWGEIDVAGAVELSAFGIGVGLSANANLGLQAPKPYLVSGKMKVKLNLPWPLPDPKATVKFEWSSHKNAKPQPLSEVVDTMTLQARKEEWTYRPSQSSHTVPGTASISWPSPLVSRSQLSGPDASIPPPGGTLVESPSGALRPLVPVDTFPSLKFDKSLNDVADLGFGNAYNAGDPHKDVVDGQDFVYDAVDVTLRHATKSSLSNVDLSDPIDGTLYGNWPAIPFTADRPADNALDIFSKNGFRYYANTTYLGYAEDGDGWKEWVANHYGLLYCLDQMRPEAQKLYWQSYHYAVPDAEVQPSGDTFYPPGVAPSHATTNWRDHCPIDLDWLTEEDFVLPPYSVFRLDFEGRVHGGSVANPSRRYANSIVFHTEGPPLRLDDYVRATVPEFPERPFYRDHHVGIQFNANYMNKLYREQDQFFQLQILDENEVPIPGTIETLWDEASAFSLSESETAWVQLLTALGAVSTADLPRDDLVHARMGAATTVRPAERHIVRTWLQDPRLVDDSRLDSAAWLERSGPDYFDADGGRAVLYEFGFTASRFDTFPDVFQPFVDDGSTWFALEARGDPNSVVSVGLPLNGEFADGTTTVGNGSDAAIGVFLRHLLSPRAPEDTTPRSMHDYIRRTPGYADQIAELSKDDVRAISDVWRAALGLFDEIDEALKLERAKEPLPEVVEVNVLVANNERLGLLVELPEALDFSRIAARWQDPLPGADDVMLVPSAANDRFFVFLMGSSGAIPLIDGTHTLELTFHLDSGDANPVYFADPPRDTETVSLSLELPDGQFQIEDAL